MFWVGVLTGAAAVIVIGFGIALFGILTAYSDGH